MMKIGPDGEAEEFLNGIHPSPPPPDDRRNDLCFASGGDRMFVSDAVRGLIYVIQSEPSTGADPEADLPPRLTELHGNYPNPFNPSTTLRFALSAEGPVTLEIYDLSGRRVRQLLRSESLPACEHAVVWDGRDDEGRAAAAGVYLVSLRTREKSFSGKIVLVK
ncbi:MAG: T9SS type A sorting domain-containing protein [bacterium]|nr:T9SS type A sorting domain-containing protein [bacterium]